VRAGHVGAAATLIIALVVHMLFGRVMQLELRAGQTALGDPKRYPKVFMTEEQRSLYFRDGAVILRNALRLDALQEIYLSMQESHREKGFFANGYYMENPAAFDFVVYSNLAHLASQVFDHPGTEESIHVWKTFVGSRMNLGTAPGPPGMLIGWMECTGDLPATWPISLPEPWPEHGFGTMVLNQSRYALDMPTDEERGRYWRGELPVREGEMGNAPGKPLPKLQGIEVSPSTVIHMDRIKPGDLIVINPCAWHSAPNIEELSPEGLPVLLLQPSFAAAMSKADTPYGYHTGEMGDCLHGIEAHQPLTESASQCFPQAFPEDKRPARGTPFSFRRNRW
ncbi:unnamed protein product, partial [Polarella glacialis]